MSVMLVIIAAIILAIHGVGMVKATHVIARNAGEEHPPEGIFVDADGAGLHLYELKPVAPSPGLPVVLLHGENASALDMLHGPGAELARTRCVYIPDRPGHGWSSRPGRSAEAAPDIQMRRIMTALAARGVNRFIIVGHSLAAALVVNALLDHADRVAGGVILAGITHPSPLPVRWWHRLATVPFAGFLFVHSAATPLACLRFKSLTRRLFSPQPVPVDYARNTAASLALRPPALRCNAQDMSGLPAFLRDQSARYATITAPVTLLADPADPCVPTASHSQRFAGQVRTARLVPCEGAGHQIHHTAKAVVLAEIERMAALADRAG